MYLVQALYECMHDSEEFPVVLSEKVDQIELLMAIAEIYFLI